MKAIIGCEESQAVTIEARKNGVDAFSCDIQESSGGYPEWHIQDDVLNHLEKPWDFIGLHPSCQYLTNSGVRWLYNKDGSKNIDRWIKLEEACNFFNLVKSKIKNKGYLENPIPHKHARDGFYSVVTGEWVKGIGEYQQKIQPWQFGHGETKATCFWLVNLYPLEYTNIVDGREQKVHKMAPSKYRTKLRSKTYKGIASAIAKQWIK